MTVSNKKPGACRQPGKDKTRPKNTGMTPAQRAIHRRILEESVQAKLAGGLVEARRFPHLAALLKSAKLAAWQRRKMPARMFFMHEGQSYAAKFTSLGRIIVERRETGEVIAASGIFAV